MPKVFINPGHAPGVDPGAVNSATGLQEANVVKNIGEHVVHLLGEVGYDSKLVQNDSLGVICQQSDDWAADVFVSIHCNSAASSQAQGTETYHLAGSSEGQKLAECLQKQVVDTTGFVDRGIKTARFYVLTNTDAPAALVEVGFINNNEEAACLGDARKQYEYARAIARGISDYFAN